jgi:hypothetical protein
MRRSSILDAVLVMAFMVGATAMTAFVRGLPERCPQPAPSSVEALFAPCLAAERPSLAPAADLAALYLPPPAARGGTAVATTPRDVDATGSVQERR